MQLEVGADQIHHILLMNNYFRITLKKEGVFVAGTCTGPKNINETLNDAKSAALAIINYFDKLANKN